ncbi:MAG: hypothetical protein JKX94_04875, partial [Sneathiella sp.]|nr:hypothetical protein [Sneathiella sp.]
MRQINITADDRPVRSRNSATKRSVKTGNRARKKKAARNRSVSIPGGLLSVFRMMAKLSLILSQVKKRQTKPKSSSRRRGQGSGRRLVIMAGIGLLIATPVGMLGYHVVQQSLIQK